MIGRQAERDEIDEEINRRVAEALRARNTNYISEENVLQYNHGNQWSHVDANGGQSNPGEFVTHVAETSISMARIRDNDVRVVRDYIREMSGEMHKQFAQSLFSMVNEAATSIGNIVHIGAHDGETLARKRTDQEMQAGLRELFGKMELGIDSYGAVSYPSMFLHPSNKRMIEFVNSPQDPAFEAEIAELNEAKEKRAIAGEAERQSRFRRP